MTGDRPRALITGASRGIGAATARELGESYDLLLVGRDLGALAELAEGLPAAVPWHVDLADLSAVRAACEIDHLDVLVHSAGVWEPGSVEETTPETWRQIFAVNLFAVAELTRRLLPALRAARGQVILINSTAGKRASPMRVAYSASKFALRAFADALRAEEASNGVSVISIYPGRVATEMQRRVRVAEGGSFDAAQYLTPESVARAVYSVVSMPREGQVTEIVVVPREE